MGCVSSSISFLLDRRHTLRGYKKKKRGSTQLTYELRREPDLTLKGESSGWLEKKVDRFSDSSEKRPGKQIQY